jgi:hypothetical protein
VSEITRLEEILGLVEKIKPLLAHNDPQVQSVVLAELLSIWLAGFHVLDDPEATEQLRAQLLGRHCGLVRELTAINAKMMDNPQRTKRLQVDGTNFFWDLVSVLGEEELIRIEYRLRKAGKEGTAGVLREEFKEREGCKG